MSTFAIVALLIGQIATLLTAIAQININRIYLSRIKLLEAQVFSMLTKERRAS